MSEDHDTIVIARLRDTAEHIHSRGPVIAAQHLRDAADRIAGQRQQIEALEAANASLATVIIRAGTDGGTVEVKPNGDVVILPGAAGNVYLGDGAATKKVALADDVDARLLKLQATAAE